MRDADLPRFETLAEGPLRIRPLPGQSSVVFTLYGTPGEPEPLRELIAVMRQEAYDRVKAYFTGRHRDLLGRTISVTGHSHYEAYAAEWGARCVGLELGENIGFTQSKLAFARGASRRWNVPWSVQVSPWFHGACTTHGPLVSQPGGGVPSSHPVRRVLRCASLECAG